MKRALVLALAALTVFAAVAVAAPKQGKYTGKVAAGYGGPQMQVTVSKGKVKNVVARIFWRCRGGSFEQAVVAPSRAYKIRKGGKFKGKSTESIGGIASETVWISGTVKGSKITGKIRSQYVGGGETCDTQERSFSLRK